MPLDILLAALGAIALLARVGLALYAAGLVRSKNSAGMVVRMICDLCLTTLVFWGIGAAILFQRSNGILSIAPDLIFANVGMGNGLIFFVLVMVLMATGGVAGATAERFRFFPLCGASILLGGLILPICANWAWFGWLSRRGFIDVAGGAALHVSAGVCAAIAAIIAGPRTGKFNRDGSSSMIPGHNLPLASIGTMLWVVGWLAYLAGAAWICTLTQGHSNPFHHSQEPASAAAFQGLLSAAAAGFMAILVGQFRYGKPDVVLGLMGFVGGLVAIASGAGVVGGPGAAVIGLGAGVLIPVAAVAIDLRLRIDDPMGLIAIQVLAGAWGTLATGLFGAPSGVNRFRQIGIQFIGVIAIAAFSAVVSFVFFAALKYTVGIRAREADEFDGLDLAEHDIGAYPDFQQTMIKSYHLREM